ncbi:MAG: nucleotide exchange factor GrpE [Desulfobacterales bacterium]
MAENKDSNNADDSLNIEDMGIPLGDIEEEPIPLDQEVAQESDLEATQTTMTDIDAEVTRDTRQEGDPDAIYTEILEDQEDKLMALGGETSGEDDSIDIIEEYDGEFDNGILPLSELEDPRREELAGEPSEETPDTFGPPSEDVNLSQVYQKLEDLTREFQSSLKYDAHKEKIIDALHQELQGHKENLVRKLMMNTFKDIIKIIDDIKKMAQHFKANQTLDQDPAKVLGFLEAVPGDLEDVLLYQGVNPYISADDEFDPTRQRVMNKITTDNPDQDKTIAEHVRPGYEHEKHVIRPELVNVYVFEEKPESTSPKTSTHDKEL